VCVRVLDFYSYRACVYLSQFHRVNTEVFIVKISSAGSVVWSKSYGTDPDIDRGYAIVESTQSTGYVVAGSGQPHGADHDMVMMKVDANG
jgi:hypothetical protein